MATDRDIEQLRGQIEDLSRELAEAKEDLRAIRGGEVDALLVQTSEGSRVFTLENAYEPYRVFLDHLQQGALALLPDGIVLYYNQCFADILGVPSEQVLGGSIYQLIGESHRGVLEELLCPASGRAHDAEIVLERADGDPMHVYTHVTVMPDGTRFAVLTDVTERKQLEERFRHAQKMEAVGRLAGGIAHDFNNMLTAILGYCEIVMDSVQDRPQILADIDEIRHAGERAAQLTRQLLAFSRRQHLMPRVFDLNQLVRDTQKMLTRVIGEDVRLNVLQDSSVAPIKADPGQIEQVLMNLAVNARDAMPDGGELTIALGDAQLDAEFVKGHPGSAAGRHTCVVVRDTGCGIPPEVLSHIFEPFFTTKASGKGTGLGLSTVYSIVKQSHGYIGVESTSGAGTTFTVYLPAVNEPLDAVPRPPAAAARRTQHETILLVEDEPPVRAVIAKMLANAGYHVLVADDAERAMTIAQSYESPIHLLVSDVIMPDMCGPVLAQRLVTRRPGMRVLYVSGFSGQIAIDLGETSSGTSFLHKPFTAAALVSKVREQLDTRP